jgi:hypothetical protein
MVRRLPDDDPVKRRRQIFKRVYQHHEHWRALMEDRGVPPFITDEVTGEDIYIADLLVGLDSLPPQQRKAFELICLQGYTQDAARDVLLPNSKSSTPVQQYADSGLIRMIAKYDEKQAGHRPSVDPSPALPTKRRSPVMVLHALVRSSLESTRAELMSQLAEIKNALAQVDELLGTPKVKAPDKSLQPEESPVDQPAPNPRPEGRPSLAQAAKELAHTG